MHELLTCRCCLVLDTFDNNLDEEWLYETFEGELLIVSYLIILLQIFS